MSTFHLPRLDKPVLAIKDDPEEGLGILDDVLEVHSIERSIVGRSARLPDPRGFGAVFVFGGSASANDDTREMEAETQLVRKSVRHSIPYFGICLGMHSLVRAYFGNVVERASEFGMFDSDGDRHVIIQCAVGQQDPIFEGLPRRIEVFQLHAETVDPAPWLSVLARGSRGGIQAVRLVGLPAYGFQPHFELTPRLLDKWCHEVPDRLIEPETLRHQFSLAWPEFEETSRRMFGNCLRVADLVT